MHRFLLPLILLFTASAHATSIELELSQGSQTKSQQLSADGKFSSDEENSPPKKHKKTETDYRWNLSYTHTAVEVKQASGSNITDNSHAVTMGASLETPSRFYLGADLDYSRTPDENLQSYGPTVTLGYTYKPAAAEGDDEDDFTPSIGADLTLGYSNYVQTFKAGSRRRLGAPTRPTSGSNEIAKRSVTTSLKASPWSWVSAKVSYTKYSFNKDVSAFLQYLDVHAIGRLSAGMEDALAGFYDHSLSFDLSFYILEDWELDLSHSISTVVVDDSHVSYDKAMLYVDLNDAWRFGLGAEVSHTDSATAVSSSDKTGYLSLNYFF